jgi:hypothetical protein
VPDGGLANPSRTVYLGPAHPSSDVLPSETVCVSPGDTEVAGRGPHGRADLTPRLARVLRVPEGVQELQFDLRRERAIRVTGRDRKGNEVDRILKVTGKGKLLLV